MTDTTNPEPPEVYWSESASTLYYKQAETAKDRMIFTGLVNDALPSDAVRLAPRPTEAEILAEPVKVECPMMTCAFSFVGDDAGEQCVAHVLAQHDPNRVNHALTSPGLAPQDETRDEDRDTLAWLHAEAVYAYGVAVDSINHYAAELSRLQAELAKRDELIEEVTTENTILRENLATERDGWKDIVAALSAQEAGLRAENGQLKAERDEARQATSDEANAYRLRKKRSDEQAKTIEQLRADNGQLAERIAHLEASIGHTNTRLGDTVAALAQARRDLKELRARFGVSEHVDDNRCPSCEHRIHMHGDDGCLQEIGYGPGDEPCCCPCTTSLDRPIREEDR